MAQDSRLQAPVLHVSFPSLYPDLRVIRGESAQDYDSFRLPKPALGPTLGRTEELVERADGQGDLGS